MGKQTDNLIGLALTRLAEADALSSAALVANQAARDALNQALSASKRGLKSDAPAGFGPISEHRKLHKPGRPFKIDIDPELRAFIVARVERLTFEQIKQDVAANFPPDRAVKRSSIHAWYRKTYG